MNVSEPLQEEGCVLLEETREDRIASRKYQIELQSISPVQSAILISLSSL